MKIALAGNPNSGKTTMYNALTGQNEQVGNWAGVTVDKKEHNFKKIYSGKEEILAVDLPGTYSMSPFTSEESVTRDYIKNENPDVIINIVDATNLSRSLFFTTQLLELGIPIVVALNKADVNEKKQTKIDIEGLSALLGCPVIETVSTDGEGLERLVDAVKKSVGKTQTAPYVQSKTDLKNRLEAQSEDKRRFKFVGGLVKQVESRKVSANSQSLSDKLDRALTSRWAGIPIFAVVMFLVFQISQSWVGPFLADALTNVLTAFQEWVRGLLIGAAPILSALLVDGVIGGVIAVIGFLPLVMVMYFLIALLEDCGYMSRVSVVLDPIFKKVGLSGKSVIPFVISVGCAVPGVMASRTIRNERERRATAMLAPFMPCGAKIPVISLFVGAFFDKAGWVSTVMYLSGIVIIFFCALIINKITAHRVKKSYFIIELPEYKIPSFLRAFKSMCGRGWEYIVKATTIILLCNTVVQVMQSFDWRLNMVSENAPNTSILASLAEPFAYILVPVIGYKCWQLAAAAVTGFIAKENVVGTLAVCFSVSNLINPEELSLVEGAAANEIATVFGAGQVAQMSGAAALAYLMFNLFTPPCFAAIGAMSSEMKSAKWVWGGIGLQLTVGFTVGYLVYTIGILLSDASALNIGAAVGGAVYILVAAAVITLLSIRASRKART